MSTRRTTRAASRASSHGASPAPSTVAATPRRTRRSGNEALPAVGLRQSTAYGTNTIAQPARAGSNVGDQIDTVLHDLLAPEPTPVSRSRGRSRSQTPAAPSSADKSFGIENELFNDAKVASSSPSSLNDHLQGGQGGNNLTGILEESDEDESSPEPPCAPTRPTAPTGRVAFGAEAERLALDTLARQRLRDAGYVEPADNMFTQGCAYVVSSAKQVVGLAGSVLKSIFSPNFLIWLGVALIAIIGYSIISSGDITSVASDLGHGFGRMIPSFSTPLEHITDDNRDLYRRLTDLEHQVARIKSRKSEIDPKAVARLQNILPDLLVIKKDQDGNLIIPNDFWYALQDRIRSDDTLVHQQIDQPVQTGKGTVSGKELAREVEKVAKVAWDRYMKQNSNTMKVILADELGQKFPRLLEDNHVATKEEVIKLIRKNWDEDTAHLRTELAQLTKKFENASRQITKLQHNSGTLTREEVRTIATDILKKLIPHAQLEALINSNLRGAIDQTLTRVNHFSPATGAVVNPYLTSPTYVSPKSDVFFFTKWMRAAIQNPIPAPNPPSAALTRWEEFGDCWCAPLTEQGDGFGASLEVIVGTLLYPDTWVIEHLPSSATLNPGSAPRDVELLAYIPDMDTYNAVKSASEELFPRAEAEDLPFQYVRIAGGTYDIDGPVAQLFNVQVDMRSFGADVSKLVVRATTNWGGALVPYTCLYRVKMFGETVPGSRPI
ncbi:uncharacterized protein PAC_13343 [Phialocephala subalpina]|uniref:SUN domain-containing protein n=1 Tax=Phialocephala subalpina TaxID=576137 RepID=A0A1L7XEQ0_9HELO|nr:uncharacterized protein PAC_13343 [Phialocephala subalpina]